MKAFEFSRFLLTGTTEVERRTVARGFKLTRYFLLTSLLAIAIVAPLLYVSEYMEEAFFERTQKDQVSFFAEVQTEFMHAHNDAAKNDLLKMLEAAHVNLTHMFANTLWDDFVFPFLTQTQAVPIDQCRTQGKVRDKTNATDASTARQACFAKVGQQIQSLSRFAELDSAIRATTRGSSVFKIKVFDLRGVTVYSSEHKQIGEDKADNQGWKTAVGGHAASELTHRDRFSAFEGVVEDRDLISSYIPILNGDNKVLGIFEIYSDVSPFLHAMQDTSTKMEHRAVENWSMAARVASKNQERINLNNSTTQMLGGGLFALFYVVLLLVVRNGQRIIDRQAHEQAQVGNRARLWHQEKMTALATMAANVSHEVGNPLAIISALAENMETEKALHGCTICQPKTVLEQTDRIVRMTRQIVSFASINSEVLEPVDVNQMVKAICDFLGFDHRFRSIFIETKLGWDLPVRVVIPGYFNEALMYLLQDGLERNLLLKTATRQVQVETELQNENVMIRFIFDLSHCSHNSSLTKQQPNSRFELARLRLAEMGGRLSLLDTMIEVTLPDTPEP